MDGGRSKRRCQGRRRAQNKSAAIPSAVHYVGYVEDDETPEMIMRKFAEMERIMTESKATGATAGKDQGIEDDKENLTVVENGGDGNGEATAVGTVSEGVAADEGLSEEQLLAVFKATSAFNVKSALANNDCLLNADDMFQLQDCDDPDSDWEEFRGFWSDDEDWEAKKVSRRHRERQSGTAAKRAPGAPRAGSNYAKPKSHVVSTYNSDTGSFIRRNVNVRAVDPNAVQLIKIPPAPLPVSWGRTVKPWRPPREPKAECQEGEAEEGTAYQEHPAVEFCDFSLLNPSFQAVFINSGWENCGGIDRLRRLPIQRLCPEGFIFAWVPKHLVHGLVKLMYSWDFTYVENLTWVQLAPCNAIVELESEYMRSSHLTLYIFRKNGEGRDIELKHQRNPDVTFDCVVRTKGRSFKVPDEVFVAIETLLPNGKGKFLELWAEKDVQRKGWTHIVELSE